MIWARIAGIMGTFAAIETVDHYAVWFNSPLWLSLVMALFLPLSDIVFIIVLDFLFGDG